jgi:hypothetical protein
VLQSSLQLFLKAIILVKSFRGYIKDGLIHDNPTIVPAKAAITKASPSSIKTGKTVKSSEIVMDDNLAPNNIALYIRENMDSGKNTMPGSVTEISAIINAYPNMYRNV